MWFRPQYSVRERIDGPAFPTPCQKARCVVNRLIAAVAFATVVAAPAFAQGPTQIDSGNIVSAQSGCAAPESSRPSGETLRNVWAALAWREL